MKYISVKSNDGADWSLVLYTTKEDIIEKIKKLKDIVEKSSTKDIHHSASYYYTVRRLLDEFKERVDEMILFQNLEDYWKYDVVIGFNSISLKLIHVCMLYDDLDDDPVDYEVDQEFTLLEVECKNLSVEEYSKKYDVDPSTVRQWIRRGKIRTAWKSGNEWMIPELSDTPRRGFTEACYEWDDNIGHVPEEYDFLHSFNTLHIVQEKNDKKMFRIILQGDEYYRDPKPENQTVLLLNDRLKEKFELYLISNPHIRYRPDYREGLLMDVMDYYGI